MNNKSVNSFLLLLLVSSSSLFSMIEKTAFHTEDRMIKLEKKSFKTEPHLKNIDLLHKGNKLYAQQGNNDPFRIRMIGKNLRENTKDEIIKAKSGASYLYLEDVNGQLKVDSKQRLTGDGEIGATIGAVAGQLITYGIWEGVIAIVKGTSGSDIAGETLRQTGKTAVDHTAKGLSVGLGIFFGTIIPF